MSLSTLAARLEFAGGDQLGRINKQKLFSFRQSLKNDQNSNLIETPLRETWPCLFTESKVQTEYDKKYLSVEFDAQLEPGDVVRFVNNKSSKGNRNPLADTRWLIYLPRLTETAYLRAEVLRCKNSIDIDGESYWFYFQGPAEKLIDWTIKENIVLNNLNYSGTIFIKNNEKTKKRFARFSLLEINGKMWEVQSVDSITVPGILELEVKEYYTNTPAKLPVVEKVSETNTIIGKIIVYQNDEVGYQIKESLYDPKASWKIIGNKKVKIIDTFEEGRICKIKVAANAIDNFTVQYGDQTLDVNIDIEKKLLSGPQEVYPFDICSYKFMRNIYNELAQLDPLDESVITNIQYSIIGDGAIIKDSNDKGCTVEIIASKKTSFILSCQADNIISNLNIKVKSL